MTLARGVLLHTTIALPMWSHAAPHGVVAGIWAAATAALVLGATAIDLASVGLVEFVVGVVPFGVLLPLWLVNSHVVIRRREGKLLVEGWPLLYKAPILSTSLMTVEIERAGALRHPGGFVPLVGRSEDRVLGFNQDDAVVVTYGPADEPRRLSILTDHAEVLAGTIGAAASPGSGTRAPDRTNHRDPSS